MSEHCWTAVKFSCDYCYTVYIGRRDDVMSRAEWRGVLLGALMMWRYDVLNISD